MSPPSAPEFVLQENPSAVRWLDSLKTHGSSNQITYSYNPNFLSDYQGYMLEMSPEEIDRIFEYRAAGNWINTEEEFFAVSEISDARKSTITRRLRFNKIKRKKDVVAKTHKTEKTILIKDINKATAEALRKINGIGPVLSQRIVKFRNRLGGFLVKEQLFDVYGLDKEVAERVLRNYAVLQKPEISQININEASLAEIASLVYINRRLAQRIVMYREQYGPIETLEELTKIEDFPSDKIERISLYLSL